MPTPLFRLPRGRSSDLRGRLIGVYTLLIAANLLAWAWALLLFRAHPALLGTALLAYSFGLRHAVDADHIAAIDNVTRKLMQDGQRPVTVGLWFSIGHSTVVVLAALAIAVSTAALGTRFEGWKDSGAVLGTAISTLFLFAVAAMNLVILLSIWRTLRRVRRGGAAADADFDLLLNSRGLLARLFRPLFRLITEPWHMLPLGFLFGLGFETATEVSLLGLSAVEAGQGLPLWSIMVFPALFTAGMSGGATPGGGRLLGGERGALVNPLRKLHYNLVITAVSVAVAVLIGGIEALGLLGDQLGLQGGFWDAVGALNDNFGALGFGIISLFILAWTVSLLAYRYARADARSPGEAG